MGPSQFKSGDDVEIRADNNRSAWLGPPVWKTHISIDLASDPVRLTQTGLKVDHKSVRQVPSKEPVPTEPSLGRKRARDDVLLKSAHQICQRNSNLVRTRMS